MTLRGLHHVNDVFSVMHIEEAIYKINVCRKTCVFVCIIIILYNFSIIINISIINVSLTNKKLKEINIHKFTNIYILNMSVCMYFEYCYKFWSFKFIFSKQKGQQL